MLLQRFRNLTRLPAAEASFYLEAGDFNFEKAVANWREDMAWEFHQVP